MADTSFYAHGPGAAGLWQRLEDHLLATAERARRFAEIFGAGDLAYWAGLWHDLGKFNPEWQSYLEARCSGRPHDLVPHAIWGAALAYRLVWRGGRGDAEAWKEVALPIAGHHAGLPDGGSAAQSLERFLAEKPDAQRLASRAAATLPSPPVLLPSPRPPTRRELFIRMVFSALVDADSLDTEQHLQPDLAAARGVAPTLAELWRRLQQSQQTLMEQVRASEAAETPVNQVRREVYDACCAEAAGPPGIYRLTVPTGGGKTRSGLAFALAHAVAHGQRRVVVAIPYTSIIEQTAGVYREILGDEAVLEHHSQVEPRDDEDESPFHLRLRLASENWDAPIIVTTTVQLFESLFSNRRGRVRKLHNLARSVIVLDEAQALPTNLLESTADALRALVEEYGATLVLSTATQPALEDATYLRAFRGLKVREIVPGYERHFAALRRVRYERLPGPISVPELARQVAARSQVMVVLNSRRAALALLAALGEVADVFHLSTLLCPAHRRAVLDEVRSRLGSGRPVRLVSTQVVEAGVDLDFPEVWRALGPLDRIVQAAGRCNREGRRQEGRVVIFELAGEQAPRGPYWVALQEARRLLEARPAGELHRPGLYREYFRRLFSAADLDEKGIQPLRRALNYPAVAETYRLIQEDTIGAVVDYGEGLAALAAWCRQPSRAAWRRLQQYLVGVYCRDAARLLEEGLMEVMADGLYRWCGDYDERLGMVGVLEDPSDVG